MKSTFDVYFEFLAYSNVQIQNNIFFGSILECIERKEAA